METRVLKEVQDQITQDPRLGDGKDMNAPVGDSNLQSDDANNPNQQQQPEQADAAQGQQQDAETQNAGMNDADYLQQDQTAQQGIDPNAIAQMGNEAELERQRKLKILGLLDSLTDHAKRIEDALNKTEADSFDDEEIDKSDLMDVINVLDGIKDKIYSYKTGGFVDDPYERNMYVYGLLRTEFLQAVKQIRAILKLDEDDE